MKKKKLKVSFLVSAFNEEKYIGQCLQSCLNEASSDTEIEICVIDDGSSDNTAKIITGIARNNKQVKFRKFTSNQGKVAGFNAAWILASGDYLALIGADDICYPGRVEKSISMLRNADCDVVHGAYIITDENLQPISYELPQVPEKVELNELLVSNRILGTSLMFSRRAAECAFPIPSELKFEDWWIVTRCAMEGYKIRGIQSPLVFYRSHGQNTVLSRNLSDRIASLERVYIRHFLNYQIYQALLEEKFPASEQKNRHLYDSLKIGISIRIGITSHSPRERIRSLIGMLYIPRIFQLPWWQAVALLLLGGRFLTRMKHYLSTIQKLF